MPAETLLETCDSVLVGFRYFLEPTGILIQGELPCACVPCNADWMPPPPPLPAADFEYGAFRYWKVVSSMNWMQAEAYCADTYTGHLVRALALSVVS